MTDTAAEATKANAETSEGTERKKLALLDAYSLLFRAFFGGRPLTTSDNRPTGALFTFSSMLFSMLNSEKPDAVVVCWDAPEQTIRSQQFAAYKAHRPEVDFRLTAQMPGARQIVEAFGMQSAEVGGYEADDLIGTLAVRGKNEGYRVVIITGDTDQLQLVDDHAITLQMTQRGVTEVKIYDETAVRERYGIEPTRIPDYKALTGDTSDNIPGVPGIGDKTATALLQKYGTLENLLDHVSEVTPPKAKAALEANIEQAKFSKYLATIDCDSPMAGFEIKPYAPTDADWQRLKDVFASFEFRSLLQRIPRPQVNGEVAPLVQQESLAPQDTFPAQTLRIGSAEELAQALNEVRARRVMALQLDMDSPAPLHAEVRGIAFASGPDVGYYVGILPESGTGEPIAAAHNLFGDDSAGKPTTAAKRTKARSESDAADSEQEIETGYQVAWDKLRDVLENPDIAKSGHNVKPVEIALERRGLSPTPFAFDTMIAAYLLNAGRASYPLMDMAESHLKVRLDADAYAPHERLAKECALIAALTSPLREALAGIGATTLMDKIEMPLVPVLAKIERTGLVVDIPYMETLAIRLGQEMDAIASRIYEIAGETFNIGSVKKLQEILFDKLHLPTGKKLKTGFSTGADLLESLAGEHEIARKILDYREIAKLKSTYADALIRLINPDTGRVHTTLNQTVASTGRLSSSDPNLQNIPVRSEIGREIRRAFVAPKGKVLLSCDYSQIELRLLAHVTKDPALVEAFTTNGDVHVATAMRVFGVPANEVTPDQRRQAKTINFAVIYGQSGFALANTLGVSTSTATAWIKTYFEGLPGVKQYIDDTTALAHRQKYVSTLLGRRRYMPELDSGNAQMRQFAERAAANMPIQGTAADIIKIAMPAVQSYLDQECEETCRLLLQVHDELLFEVDAAHLQTVVPEIRRRMETASLPFLPLDVPLRADAKYGLAWSEMQAIA